LKKVINALEMALSLIPEITPKNMDASQRRNAVCKYVQLALADAKAPRRWYTPEQWKERTGEEWPDDWAVYACGDSDDIEWIICTYKEAQEMSRVNDTWIICATEAGKPPDNWNPEGAP
jgi:hypothetical protein